MTVLNHEWWKPETFTSLGTYQRRPGRRTVRRPVPPVGGGGPEPGRRRARRALVVGPVFPHEVVGFSGGNKYFFPGVAGQEVIDFSHWLGALITSAEIIGTRGITPVRALINEAAAMIPSRAARAVPGRPQSGTSALHAAVVRAPRGGLGRVRRGVRRDPRPLPGRAGAPGAVDHPDQVRGHVDRRQGLLQGRAGRRRRRPGHPLRPAHHRRSRRCTRTIPEIGYHCRDYFLGQWDRFKDYHWGDLAHSTHLRGAGTWDAVDGERGRVTVTLATGIPEDMVRADQPGLPATRPRSTSRRMGADPDTLVVPQAGEVLYRLR